MASATPENVAAVKNILDARMRFRRLCADELRAVRKIFPNFYTGLSKEVFNTYWDAQACVDFLVPLTDDELGDLAHVWVAMVNRVGEMISEKVPFRIFTCKECGASDMPAHTIVKHVLDEHLDSPAVKSAVKQ